MMEFSERPSSPKRDEILARRQKRRLESPKVPKSKMRAMMILVALLMGAAQYFWPKSPEKPDFLPQVSSESSEKSLLLMALQKPISFNLKEENPQKMAAATLQVQAHQHPVHETGLTRKAYEALLSERWQEAQVLYETLLKESPHHLDHLYHLAVARQGAGNTEGAAALYAQLLHKNGENFAAYYGLFLCLRSLPLEQALALLNKMNQPSKESGFISGQRALVLFYAGKTDEALSFLEKAVQKNKNSLLLLYTLGTLYEDAGYKSLADKVFENLLSRLPETAGPTALTKEHILIKGPRAAPL